MKTVIPPAMAFLLLWFSSPLPSQPAIPACPTGGGVLPCVQIENAFNGISNQVRFSVRWPTDASAYYPNPPRPIGSSPDGREQWVYFWMFGDGTYSSEAAPLHAYADDGAYQTALVLSAIYSGNDEPPAYASTVSVNRTATVAPPNHQVFGTDAAGANDNSLILIRPDWAAAANNDTLVAAISYRNLRSETPASGKVRLKFPREGFTFIGVCPWSTAPGPRSIQGASAPSDTTVVEWTYTDLAIQETNTFFVYVRAQAPSSSNLETRDVAATGEVSHPLIAELTQDGEGLVGTFNLLNLLGLQPRGQDDVYGNPNPYYIIESDRQLVAVSAARDPNYIEVDRSTLWPGALNQELRYQVHFQNLGSGGAETVAVTVTVDSLLDRTGGPLSTIQVPRGSNYLWTVPSLPLSAFQAPWLLRGQGGLRVVLPGKLQVSNEADSKGQIGYRIRTSAAEPLRRGQLIQAQALIEMNGDESVYITNIAETRVEKPRGLALGPYFGIKYSYNGASPGGGIQQFGHSGALTLRWPLKRVDHSLLRNSRVSLLNLPAFWWQVELGASWNRWSDADGPYDLWHLDLSPLLIRWIPVLPAGLPFPLNNRRFLGFSGGYTASYWLSGEQNGVDFSAPEGLGNRLDHSLSASLDAFNLLGRPGLSAGVGWKWRNTRLLGGSEWFQHPFWYLHLTF